MKNKMYMHKYMY